MHKTCLFSNPCDFYWETRDLLLTLLKNDFMFACLPWQNLTELILKPIPNSQSKYALTELPREFSTQIASKVLCTATLLLFFHRCFVFVFCEMNSNTKLHLPRVSLSAATRNRRSFRKYIASILRLQMGKARILMVAPASYSWISARDTVPLLVIFLSNTQQHVSLIRPEGLTFCWRISAVPFRAVLLFSSFSFAQLSVLSYPFSSSQLFFLVIDRSWVKFLQCRNYKWLVAGVCCWFGALQHNANIKTYRAYLS